MQYLAKIFVSLKPTVNDPQGQTVLAGLKTLGFSSPQVVRVGKYFEVQLDSSSRHEAESQVHNMCDKLLANPVMEEFSYQLSQVEEAGE